MEGKSPDRDNNGILHPVMNPGKNLIKRLQWKPKPGSSQTEGMS